MECPCDDDDGGAPGPERRRARGRRAQGHQSSDVPDAICFSRTRDLFATLGGDRGWGCGYRNIQVLFSHMLSTAPYSSHLRLRGVSEVPTIGRLQEMIESAWGSGEDAAGRAHFGGRLAHTRGRIGSPECAALLRSLGVGVRAASFALSGEAGHAELVQWAWRHFVQGGSSSISSSRAPLYLQHQGHSRSVVGVERRASGETVLLIADPSMSKSEAQRALVTLRDARGFRRTAASLKAPLYEIVTVNGTVNA
eukprot:m51a1_g9474 hypothetical protein (252) ;mRNA; f:584249-585599